MKVRILPLDGGARKHTAIPPFSAAFYFLDVHVLDKASQPTPTLVRSQNPYLLRADVRELKAGSKNFLGRQGFKSALLWDTFPVLWRRESTYGRLVVFHRRADLEAAEWL